MSETTNFSSGAVRSADANHLDFTSLPLIGLLGVARTASEGAAKYGRYNYMKGMPVHDLINHVFRHLIMDTLGDRSEPHLEHAGWGILSAIQSRALDPEISEPHMLGPGATLTDAVRKHLDENAPLLKARREAGEFDESGNWNLADLPEIQTLIEQRCDEEQKSCQKTKGGIETENKPPDPPPTIGPPSSFNKIYGWPTRVERMSVNPTPGDGEMWINFHGGTRAYYLKRT